MAVESMRGQTDLSQLERARQLRERVAEACQFVGSGQGVSGVHIVTGARPTYEDLRLYQDCAAASHVRLTVDGHGMITVRPVVSQGER
jgi:hypothetical protein